MSPHNTKTGNDHSPSALQFALTKGQGTQKIMALNGAHQKRFNSGLLVASNETGLHVSTGEADRSACVGERLRGQAHR